MRCLVICLMLLLTGCSNLSLSDLATGSGATVGAVVGSATGLGLPAVAVTSGLGAVAGSAVVGETVTTAEACADNPEVCSTISFYTTLQDIWHWLVGAGVILIIAAWLIPGPQLLWRKKDAKSNTTDSRYRRRRGR